jgi:hypothetical protein
MVRREGCTVLAGASPASVSAGAPSSRVQSRAERHGAERTVKSLVVGGSKDTGRNRVNAEQASSEYQPKGAWERRAGHSAAKATHSPRSRPVSGLGLPGVWAAARVDRTVRNTRDPSRQPPSGEDRAHKAGAESARSRAGVRGAHSTGEGGESRWREGALRWSRWWRRHA